MQLLLLKLAVMTLYWALLINGLTSIDKFFINKKQFHNNIAIWGKRKGVNAKRAPDRTTETDFVIVEDIYSDGWKLDTAVKALQNGAVGVIPTDTCYSFVTIMSNDNRKGMERILQLKSSSRKPLSVICRDISMASMYSANLKNEKWMYKMLKSTLPGPFTYIMPTSENVPKMIVDRKHHKLKKINRKEIGVRIPDDPLVQYIIDQVNEPLLCGSIPQVRTL